MSSNRRKKRKPSAGAVVASPKAAQDTGTSGDLHGSRQDRRKAIARAGDPSRAARFAGAAARYIPMLLLVILPALAYAPTFHFPLCFEDYEVAYVLDAYDWRRLLGLYLQPATAFHLYYRPTGDVLGWLGVKTTGSDAFAQHGFYYLMLLAETLGIYTIASTLHRSRAVAFWAALIFAMAPVQLYYFLSTGTFAFDRGAVLFSTWSLVTASTRLGWSGRLGAALLLALALTSKDTALVFPGLLAAYAAALALRAAAEPASPAPRASLGRLLSAAPYLGAVFMAYAAFKTYSAFALGKGGLPVGDKVNPQILMNWTLDTALRNLRIHLAYQTEILTWGWLPLRSLPSGQTVIPPAGLLALPALYLGVFAADCGLLARRAVRAGGRAPARTLLPAIVHFGAWWAALALVPILFFRETYRVTYYMALFPSLGVALLAAAAVAGALGLLRAWGRTAELAAHAAAVAALVISTALWLPGAIRLKEPYRSRMAVGTEILDDLVANLKTTGMGEGRRVLVAGLSTSERRTLLPIRSIPFMAGIPRNRVDEAFTPFDWLDVDPSGKSKWNLGPTDMVAVALTDRFALLEAAPPGGASPSRPVAVGGAVPFTSVLNGGFTGFLNDCGSLRPRGWVPFPADTPPRVRPAPGGGVRVTASPGAEPSGLKQAVYLEKSRRYRLDVGSVAGSAAPGCAVDVVRRDPPLSVARLAAGSANVARALSWDAREDGVYDIRLLVAPAGMPPEATAVDSTMLVGSVTLTDVGPATDAVAVALKSAGRSTLSPALAESKLARPLPAGAEPPPDGARGFEIMSSGEPGGLRWPILYGNRSDGDRTTARFALTFQARAASSAKLDLMLTTMDEEGTSPMAAEARSHPVSVPLSRDRWTSHTILADLDATVRRYKWDVVPMPYSRGDRDSGSVWLSGFEMVRLGGGQVFSERP